MPNAKISLNVVQFKSEDDVFRTQSILLIITRNKKKVIQCCKFQYFTTDQHWLSASFWITVTLLLEYLFCAFKTTWAEQLFSEPIRFSFLLIPWVQYTRFWKVRVEKYFIFRKMKKTFITSVLVTVWGTCMVSQMFQSTSVKVSKRESLFFLSLLACSSGINSFPEGFVMFCSEDVCHALLLGFFGHQPLPLGFFYFLF